MIGAGRRGARGPIRIGSVKSMIGHLKSAAGAARPHQGRAALHDKVLPPSINFRTGPRRRRRSTRSRSRSRPKHRAVAWEIIRHPRAGVSAFGFGGTNFHVVLEEHVPGHADAPDAAQRGLADRGRARRSPGAAPPRRGRSRRRPAPLVLGAADEAARRPTSLRTPLAEARQGRAPRSRSAEPAALRAPERLAIDYARRSLTASPRPSRAARAESGEASTWPALRARGIYEAAARRASSRSSSRARAASTSTCSSTCAPASRSSRTRSPRPTRSCAAARGPAADGHHPQGPRAPRTVRPAATEITQPATLTVDVAILRLLGRVRRLPRHRRRPLARRVRRAVAAGTLTVRGRARRGERPRPRDGRARARGPGQRWPAMAPLAEVEEVLAEIPGYVVAANKNCPTQTVIGGATEAVGPRDRGAQGARHHAFPLPVSHAFHTGSWPAPASRCARTLQRLDLKPPQLPIVANVDGEQYPTTEEEMLDILAPPGRLARAVRQGPAHALTRRAHLRRGRTQARPAGVRLRRARRRQGAEPGHQPSEGRRHRDLQQRAVRPLGRRPRGRHRAVDGRGRRARSRAPPRRRSAAPAQAVRRPRPRPGAGGRLGRAQPPVRGVRRARARADGRGRAAGRARPPSRS